MGNTLEGIDLGRTAQVRKIETRGAMRARLMDIGLTRGARVTCLYAAPSGDPRAYWMRGAVIALRGVDAKTIEVTEGGEREWD